MSDAAPWEPRPGMLLSYWYYRTHKNIAMFADPTTGQVTKLIADSGAFSAHSLGGEVKLDEYMEWAERWKHLFDHYVQLDVIGDWQAGYQNLLLMGREMPHLSILPVYHLNEPWSHLERLIDDYPYICIGGMVSKTLGPQEVLKACAKALALADKKGTKVHGLGQTRWDMLSLLPWWSVDSSSYSSGSRYGVTMVWDEKAKRPRQMACGTKQAHRWGDWLRRYGFDPKKLTDRSTFDYKEAIDVSCWTFHLYERFLRQRFGNPDFNLYFAISPPEFGMRALNVIDRLRQAGH